jgi:hypothetical protein
MIRLTILAGALLLAGCGEVRMKSSQGMVSCGHDMIGKVYMPRGSTVAFGMDVVREENLSGPIRVVPPGGQVTQDYVPGRTTIFIGNDGRINDVKCG